MSQKLDVKAFANTAALVVLILGIICIALYQISAELAIKIFNYTLHGINISSIVAVKSLADSIIGLVIVTITSWLTALIFAIIYNKFSNK